MDENLEPTEEEARILELLTPDWWKTNAHRRGIRNTTIEEARLTKSGVVARINLLANTTHETLEKQLPQIRTLLDVQDIHQTDLLPGGRASRVALAVRTRRVTDTMDMTWRPGITSIGVDTITGEEVYIPHTKRIRLAGASGAGKSWSTRPLIAPSVINPQRKVYLIDGKGEEAQVWCDVCETAVEPDEIINLIDHLHDLMQRNKAILKRARASAWTPDLGPENIVLVDEGRVVLAILAAYDKLNQKVEDGEEPVTPSLRKLIDLSSLGRSRGIILIWCTQYPTTSGANPGIDPQINANVDDSFCLRVNTFKQAQVMLEENARFGPHRIPSTPEMRGHGFLDSHGMNLIRTWTLDDDGVRGLKAYQSGGGGSPVLPPAVGVSPSGVRAEERTQVVVTPDHVMRVLGDHDVVTAQQIAADLSSDVRSVSRILSELVARGVVGSRHNGSVHLYGKGVFPPRF